VRAFEPTFTVDDVARSERFYTEVIGFAVDQRWSEDGKLKGLLLKAGPSRLGLSQDDWAKGRDRKKGVGFSLWCQTDQDIDALAGRIKAAGGRLTAEPGDEPGLGRSLAVDDPDGFRLRMYHRG
jgi:predicted enzyme related to lactoylglutathione lyase